MEEKESEKDGYDEEQEHDGFHMPHLPHLPHLHDVPILRKFSRRGRNSL